jgi:hypothetical protein
MRIILGRWLIMAVCFSVAAGCVRDKNGSQSRKAGADKKSVPSKNGQTSSSAKGTKDGAVPGWMVEGWGKTEDDAKKDAVRQVRDKLAVEVRPALAWTPPVDYILQNFLSGDSQRRPDEDMPINGEQLQCYAWTMTLSTKQVEAMRREDDKYRTHVAAEARAAVAKVRLEEMGKLVGCIVLALTGVSLYLRLDSWAEGTRRRWLRLALSSAVAATGVGWWFLS